MLHHSNCWQKVMSSVADGTRPVVTLWGTSITPGNNTYGTYTEIMADSLVTDEAFMIDIFFSANAVAATSRDTLVTIGVDFAGGTTYTDMEIPHLLATGASVANIGKQWYGYRFPLRIPAGSAIAAKASVNNVTVGTLGVSCVLYGKPSAPELVRYGTFVRAYGADTANSRGTLVTAGTVSEGSWTDLGTLADDIWAWEFGYGTDSSSLANAWRHVDIGVGSTQKVVIPNAVVSSDNGESISKTHALWYGDAKSGEHVHGRIQHSNAADSNASLIAYGIGG